MKAPKTSLPKSARNFFKEHPSRKYKQAIRAFHRWMSENNLCYKKLNINHIKKFLSCPNKKVISICTQNEYRMKLAKYLIWLHKKKLISFDPLCFQKRKKTPLCATARQFLDSLEPILERRTINGYRGGIRLFHRWIDENKISLKKIQRQDTSAWLQHINGLGYTPRTRRGIIIFVRVYLRWLQEQKLLTCNADELLKNSDKPKEPKYLPRPLPPAADQEIQKRLELKKNVYCQALLLMRLTGLRIGELMSLELNCIRHDNLGNQFLKVPLGKLKTERLVPLNKKALKTIKKIQKNKGMPKNRAFLLETENGNKTSYEKYSTALKEVSTGLETNGTVVTHRLRHSYATSLLDGGMSLVGIMKLLGHNDISMTLRYAEITQHNVREQYFQAILHIEKRYPNILNNIKPEKTHPSEILNEAIHLIQKLTIEDNVTKSTSRALIKRIVRIQQDWKKLSVKKMP